MTELWSGGDSSVTLHGVRCVECGAVLFPPNPHGCERCGAITLEPAEVAAAGTLRSFAVVHLHPRRATPYTIGEIELDAGPTVRALLSPAAEPRIGSRVAATVSGDDLQFEPAQ
jgi:hypothetical protein